MNQVKDERTTKEMDRHFQTWVPLFARAVREICELVPFEEFLERFPEFQEVIMQRIRALKWYESEQAHHDVGIQTVISHIQVKPPVVELKGDRKIVTLCLVIPHGNGKGYFTETMELTAPAQAA